MAVSRQMSATLEAEAIKSNQDEQARHTITAAQYISTPR